MFGFTSHEHLWIYTELDFNSVKIRLSRNCEATIGMPVVREGVLNIRKPREDKDYHTW